MTYDFNYFHNLFKNADLKFTLVHSDKTEGHNKECDALVFENLKFGVVTKYIEIKSIESEMITFGNHIVTIICDKNHACVFRYDCVKDCKFGNKTMNITLDDDSVVQINF